MRESIIALANAHRNDPGEMGDHARLILSKIGQDPNIKRLDTGFHFIGAPPCYSGEPAALVVLVDDGLQLGKLALSANMLDKAGKGFQKKAAELRLEWQNRRTG